MSPASDASPVQPAPSSEPAESDRARAERLAEKLAERDDLLAIVGHELRNPLHALSLQLRLARVGASGPVPEAVARIEKAQRMLDRYVARMTILFELMRSPTGEVAVRPVECDLTALVRSIADGLLPEAQFRGVELRVETPAHACMVHVDPQFVEQMVDNLLINAFKHAAARLVTLTLLPPAPGSDGPVRIEVADDGRGIAPEDRERIFGKRVVGQNSHHGTGTGLGLWIVTRLAAALGGAIALRGRPAGGSIFMLTVPLRAAPASVPASPSSAGSPRAP